MALTGIVLILTLHGAPAEAKVSMHQVPKPKPIISTWYGDPKRRKDKFHGRKTASGERFNTWDFTAAHPYLPYGTKLWVSNPSNGKSVLVKINDRGPYSSASLDLSYAAAGALGIVKTGKARLVYAVMKNV